MSGLRPLNGILQLIDIKFNIRERLDRVSTCGVRLTALLGKKLTEESGTFVLLPNLDVSLLDFALITSKRNWIQEQLAWCNSDRAFALHDSSDLWLDFFVVHFVHRVWILVCIEFESLLNFYITSPGILVASLLFGWCNSKWCRGNAEPVCTLGMSFTPKLHSYIE